MSTSVKETPRSRRGPGRKAQLVAVASRLFQERGYHNVSMEEIAHAVGLKGPALYRHFSNKHDILTIALTEQIGAVLAVVEEARAETSGDRVRTLSESLAGLVVDREETLLWKRERRHLGGETEREFRAKVRRLGVLTAEVVRDRLPDATPGDLAFVSWAYLSVFAHSASFRTAIDRARSVALMTAMGDAVIAAGRATPGTSLPVPHATSRRPAGRGERIMAAATTLFATRGFYEVGMDEVAAEADVAIATLYQYFESKADLLRAILVRGAEGLMYVTTDRLAQLEENTDPLDTLVELYVGLALGPHGRLFGVLLADLFYLPKADQEALRRLDREHVEEWVAALAARRPELSPAEVRGRVRTAMGLVADITLTPQFRSRPRLYDELCSTVRAILAS